MNFSFYEIFHRKLIVSELKLFESYANNIYKAIDRRSDR